MINQEHIDFLTKESTLKQQTLMSLKERVIQFNKTYELDEKLTVYKLKKIYTKYNIKKKVRFNKPTSNYNEKEYQLMMQIL